MNEAFRLLFDQVSSGVIWVQRNGIVRYANKAAVQMTPVMLGQPLMDPVAERTVKAAGQNMLQLPFQFELTTQEAHPDTIRAAVIDAPVGSDLMVVLNNVSQERWYAHALENLMGYIEAEMAQPIEALAGQLSQLAPLLRQQGGASELAPLTADAVALSARLGKLRDLVSVFGEGAMRRDDRILLSDLLSQALSEVTPRARARNITLSAQGLDGALPTVYGSAHWLSKAMAEYLEQSIRSAQPGGVIELAVKATGTRVLVRARNRGLFVSHHERRSAFVPFGVGDSPKPEEARQSIGLALSQRILALHGGSVRIEDEFGAVDFVLELPAGAPSTQDAQLSVEQAHRYARDMSELLARSVSRRAKQDGPTLDSVESITKAC